MLLLLILFSLGYSQKKKSTKSKPKSKAKTITVKETVIIYTEEEAEKSSEARVVAGFLKQNPGHAKTDYFKRKLFDIIMSTPPAEDKSAMVANYPTKSNETNAPSKNSSSNTAITKKETSTGSTTKTTSNSVYASNSSTPKSTSGSGKTSVKSGANPEHKRTADLLTHIFNNDPMNNQAYLNFKNNTKCHMVVKIEGKKFYNLDVPAKNQNFVLVDKGTYTISSMVCDSKYSAIKSVTKDLEIALSLD